MKILAINPGSTSTKLAIYEDEKVVWTGGAHLPVNELSKFHHIIDQYEYRRDFIVQKLQQEGIELKFDAVIGRGGLLCPLKGGVYEVNEKMKEDLLNATHEHACNLGALIADEIARECGCKAYIADPVVVDEFPMKARISGFPGIKRESIFHALNQKATARQYAASVGKKYKDMNLIVAHLGGGISIGAHQKGKVIDVNNALNGEGPISPERAGTIPAEALVNLCFSGKYDIRQIKKMIHGKGGLTGYLGTNDMITIESKAEAGEEPYRTLFEAMLYTISKQIGAMYVAMMGKVDAIILTGGMAHGDYCVAGIKEQVEYLAPVVVIPGENEMKSLAYNALGALRGDLPVLTYTGVSCVEEMNLVVNDED